MFALLKSDKPLEVVKIYESVFGPTINIRDDMIELAKDWNNISGTEQKARFDKHIIKYNNARAYKNKSSSNNIE